MEEEGKEEEEGACHQTIKFAFDGSRVTLRHAGTWNVEIFEESTRALVLTFQMVIVAGCTDKRAVIENPEPYVWPLAGYQWVSR